MIRRKATAAWAFVTATLLLAACDKRAPSMLDPRGPESRRIAGVWWLMFGLAAAVYLLVGTFIVIALVRGRRTEDGKPSRFGENAFIWLGGLALPIGILALLAVVTVTTTKALRNPERGALRVDVTAKRWWWDVRYPGTDVVTANEIHVPVNRQVEVGLDSDNVIHSFWVPQLAGKLDTIPGQRNVLRFKADRIGSYRGECAEFCGIQHARMSFLVIVDPPATFERWLAREQHLPSEPSSELGARGQLVFMRAACAGCHTIRGTAAEGTVGPDLSDIGSRHWLGAITIPNDRARLSGWIENSQTVKPGNLMPPVSLDADDLAAVVDYLEGLK